MDLLALAEVPLRYKLWSLKHLKLILNDLLPPSGYQPVLDDHSHWVTAIQWLYPLQCKKARQSDEGGVYAGWSTENVRHEQILEHHKRPVGSLLKRKILKNSVYKPISVNSSNGFCHECASRIEHD